MPKAAYFFALGILAIAVADSEIYCPAPSDPVNGHVWFSSLEYRSKLQYTCNEGYILRNSLTRYCSEDGKWTGTDPECVERTCKMPEKPLSGSVHLSGELKSGILALFSCDQGWILDGTPINKCLPSGNWRFDPPECIPISCPPPSDPVNGRASFTSTTYGSELQYTCNKGYMLRNLQTRHCTEDRMWSGTDPECVEIECKVVEKPLHGSVHLSDELKHGSIAVFSCDQGWTLVGASASKCFTSGLWEFDPPKCFQVCEDNPPTLLNGNPKEFTRHHGSVVDYECNENFEITGRSSVYCELGRLVGQPPTCIQYIRCPQLDEENTTIAYTNDRKINSQAIFSCKSNSQRLTGTDRRTCLPNGEWSGQDPSCEVHACPELLDPVGGFVEYIPAQTRSEFYRARDESRMIIHPGGSLPTGLRQVGSKAVFKCESRYYQLFGSRTRRCLKTGKWSGRPAICLPVCGHSESPRSPFIFYGNATDTGQWPWHGVIAEEDFEEWFMICGASLLNELWLITAAHCVTYSNTAHIRELDELQVYLGKYRRNDALDDEYVQVRKVQEIHIHPDYNPRNIDADIALIQLDSPVQLTYRVQPICLPTEKTTREHLVEGKRGVVTGFGDNENGTSSETLIQAVLPVVSTSNCEKAYETAGHHVTITDYMFCAGYKEGGADICWGDSGGPFMFLDKSSKGRWILEGIISWGVECGVSNNLGGYTTVSKFLEWIHKYI